MAVNAQQRFTKERPCPVCGGHPRDQRGQGARCYGYRSDNLDWVYCPREEHAGPLTMKEGTDAISHRLVGDCRCGTRHDAAPPTPQPHTDGNSPRRIVAEYDYTDEGGNLLFQAVRYEPKDFDQRQSDGKGDWIWNLKDVRRVLYRLAELMAAAL